MAVLKKDDFFAIIKAKVGDDERYKNRFYSTGTDTDPIPDPEPEEKKTEEEEKAENIQIDDLFTKADSKE